MSTPVRVCPECTALNPAVRNICRKCNADISDVATVDAESLPDEARNDGAGVRQERSAPIRVRTEATGTVITGIDIPFMQWVELLVKVSLAAIPAAIILGAIGVAIAVVIGGIGSA